MEKDRTRKILVKNLGIKLSTEFHILMLKIILSNKNLFKIPFPLRMIFFLVLVNRFVRHPLGFCDCCALGMDRNSIPSLLRSVH